MILQGDARAIPLRDESVQCVVTSPPYWGLRDYGLGPRGLGLESTPEEYVANLVEVFREVRRVLRDDGTVWLNLGDSYFGGNKGNSGPIRPWDKQATNLGSWTTRRRDSGKLSPTRTGGYDGLKVKDLCGIPWRVALSLQADGWWWRSVLPWIKRNAMTESTKDRPTVSHEYVLLLTKSERYYFDMESVKRKGTSGPSDLRNMEERLPRIGGKHKGLNDPLSKASAATNIGRRRSVGNPMRHWRTGDTWFDSMVAMLNAKRGLLAGPDDEPLGFLVNTTGYSGFHLATFPEALVTPCILAGSRIGDVVLDPFCGSGTVEAVAYKLGRKGIGIDLSMAYVDLSVKRAKQTPMGLPL